MAASAPRATRRVRRLVDDPGVVAGGDGVEAEGVGPAEQPVELEVAVALDARVRRAAGGVGGDVGRHDVLVEVVAEVEDVVLDAEAAGHARASSTSATEQQPESDSPPQNFSVTPTTS